MPATTAPDTAVTSAQQRSLLTLIAFAAVCSFKLVALQWVLLGAVRPLGAAADVAFVFLVFASADLLFPDMRYGALIITDVALSALMVGLAVFQQYYGVLPTIESMKALGQVGTLGTSIAQLYSPAKLLLIADIPLLIWWGVRSQRRGIDPATGSPIGAAVSPLARTPYVYQRRRVYIVAVLFAALLFSGVSTVRGTEGVLDNTAVARERGFLTYVTVAILGQEEGAARAITTTEAFQAEIDAIRGGAEGARVDGFASGVAAGSHVIVIQVEALQNLTIGARVGGQPVTPELDELIGRSWYFPNAFTQIGLGTTADAEFVTATSLLGPRQGASSMLYSDRTLTSLPRVLTEDGYDALTFHTNDVRFWNRSQLYPAIGFDRFFDSSYFGSADKVAFGASDAVLYSKTLEELKRRDAAGQPFYASVVSMSSHYPYIALPIKERRLKLTPEYERTMVGDYLVHVNYADRQLGAFLDGLDEAGILDKAVVVIYGDHFGLQAQPNEKDAGAIAALFGGRGYTPVDHYNVPLIVHLPGQTKGGVVTDAVGQVDIAPTIADALGIGDRLLPHFGKSAFAAGPALIPCGGTLPPGSYVDSDVLYIPGNDFASGTAWGILEREPVPLARASEQKYRAALELLDMSDDYVRRLPVRPEYDADASVILPE